VSGVVIPLRLKPVPLIATEEIVTLVPPVLVIDSESDGSPPNVTLPKLRLAGLAPRVPPETPVPDSAIVSVESEAFELMVTVPLALPPAWGANRTLNVVLCDALSVSGVVMPVSPKPVPLTEACETVTLDPPVLGRVTVWDCWLPTVTLPKVSLPGFSESCPGVDAEVPVPVSVRLVVLVALLVMVAVALKFPAALGLNLTLTVVLCPDARVIGRLGEVREKYFVEIATLLTVTEFGPELVAVAERVVLLPAATLPKFKVAADR
jgi:hypothetical protein